MSFNVTETKIIKEEYNPKTEKYEPVTYDVFLAPCREEIKKFIHEGHYDYDLKEYVEDGVKENTKESVIAEHCSKCIQCKIVSGLSNATILPSQQDVADLFGMGYDNYRTASDNFSSRNGILLHYNTIEAIRLADGTVISNNECWSRGFAHCNKPSKVPTDKYLHMDLSTVENITGRYEVIKIKIIESVEGNVLFSYEDKYYLNGRNSDNRRSFTVELVKPCSTVKEAYESMKPKEVLLAESQGLDVKRQGELFFIPINTGFPFNPELQGNNTLADVFPVTNIEKRTRYHTTMYHKECCKCGAKTEEVKDKDDWLINNHPRFSSWGATEEEKKANQCYEENNDTDSLMVLKSRETFRLTGFPTIELAVTAPRRNDHHHTATELGKLSGYIVARGTIRHTDHEHGNLELGNGWHMVVINNIVQSFSEQRGRGAD